ncbi:hypothetical protein ACEV60_26845 [Enterobacter ludwigii]|uniref:hypothetical protein n=1 Tax=Enterobacter TaxID=547 RepID=UPI003B5DC20F
MSKFQWDPTQDQTYITADGSQTVTTQTIDKVAGKSFNMNAMEQTLELQLPMPTKPTVFCWGKSSGAYGKTTNINISQGVFRVICPDWQGTNVDNSYALLSNEDYRNTTNITLLGNSRLELINFNDIQLAALDDGNLSDFTCNIKIIEDSLFSINGSDIVSILSNIEISDNAEFQIISSQLQLGMKGVGERLVVNGTPDPAAEYSLLFDSTSFKPSQGQIVSTTFKGDSVSKLISKNITFEDNLIEDNAKVYIQTDNYNYTGLFDSDISINIGSGSAELTIAPIKDNDYVFDLQFPIDEPYPEGMFNFIKNDAINNGKLILSTNSNNGFGFQQMLSMKMIYINGAPATKELEFNNEYESIKGYMVIKLRNI